MISETHQRILQALDYAGIKQAELARLTGLSPSSISLLARGLRAPERRTLVSIANACSVNIDWLADGEGPMAKANDNDNGDYLSKLAAQYDLSDRDRILVEAFLSLPPQYRAGVVEYAESLADRFSKKKSEEEQELEMKAEALKQSFILEQKEKRYPGSSGGSTDMDEKSDA